MSFLNTVSLAEKTILPVFILLFISVSPGYSQLNTEATEALLKRVVPEHHNQFEVEHTPQKDDADVFEIESKSDKIILRGSNGVSVASALHYYLKNFCNTHYTPWHEGGTALDLPEKLPVVSEKVRKSTPYQYRYYMNYVTYSYSYVWWDWERWQQEVDWMALHGINMPLAFTGQEAVWQKVFNSLGFSDKDLRNNFFVGPAFQAFNWFGLVQGLGGPLPQSWIDSQAELQKKIVKRERSLGMTPVLPAFMGNVPPGFKEKFPDAQMEVIQWHTFPALKRLSPYNDSLFTAIGNTFIREQNKMYGTDHLYAADPFIELTPPSNDPEYLRKISRTIYQSMGGADPKAAWVLETWFLRYKRDFWKPSQSEAFLDAVGDDQLIALDLYSEVDPYWQETEAYYGKPWIWNMLHNFGGRGNLFGNMERTASGPAEALHDPSSGNMTGIGLTMEAIEQNPVMYELMLANVWRDQPINIDTWLKKYGSSRYGQENKHAGKAWAILRNTVYLSSEDKKNSGSRIITRAPKLTSHRQLTYDPEDLLPAWEQMIKAAEDIGKNDAFQYDLIDLSRQVLENYALVLHRKYAEAIQGGEPTQYKEYASEFLELISDMDQLLATRKEFLLGDWVEDARSWGTTKSEKTLYEKNAKNLITLWGSPETSFIRDYSARKWAGLFEDFYKNRWKKFFDYIESRKSQNKKIDIESFNEELKKWEWEWINDTSKSYTAEPQGDPVKVARRMFDKYYVVIEKSYH